jgi:hypothetical protein
MDSTTPDLVKRQKLKNRRMQAGVVEGRGLRVEGQESATAGVRPLKRPHFHASRITRLALF